MFFCQNFLPKKCFFQNFSDFLFQLYTNFHILQSKKNLPTLYDSLIKAGSKAKIRPSQTLNQKFSVSKNDREIKSIRKERYDDIV